LVLSGVGRQRAGSIYKITEEMWPKAVTLNGAKRLEKLMTGRGRED